MARYNSVKLSLNQPVSQLIGIAFRYFQLGLRVMPFKHRVNLRYKVNTTIGRYAKSQYRSLPLLRIGYSIDCMAAKFQNMLSRLNIQVPCGRGKVSTIAAEKQLKPNFGFQFCQIFAQCLLADTNLFCSR